MAMEGKRALVTGGARGIGAATAWALANAGADVAVVDLLDASETCEKIRALGRRAVAIRGDVAVWDQVEGMVKQTVKELGGLDILVANAAYSERASFWKQSLEAFQRTIDVTMMGPFYCLRAATLQMIEQGQGGSIVVTGSPHAIEAVPDCMAYNMAKAALDQMVRTAATELIPHRIRVNVVHPGWTDTPGERRYFSENDIKEMGAQLPARRLARPDEIARGILFLACDESEYINGSTLSIDGGLLLPWNRAV
ncbi:MAG: SDR family oxidoreductase [Planctomycetota bacterium]